MLYHISTLNLYPTTPSPLLCITHSFAPLQSINNHNHSGYGILLDIIVVSPAALSTIITPPCSLSHAYNACHSVFPHSATCQWYHTGSAVFGHIHGIVHQGGAYCQAWRCRGNIIHWGVRIVH